MRIHHVTTIDDALEPTADGAMPFAGGTDFMVEVNSGHLRLTTLSVFAGSQT